MRLGFLCLVVALCVSGEATAFEFTPPTTIQQRNILDWAPCGDRTLVRTDDELVLVDWSRSDGERDSVLVADFPAGSGFHYGLHSAAGAVIALAPFGEGGHAVVVPQNDGGFTVDFVDDPDWLPPQVWLGGEPWFAEEWAQGVYLHPALGREGERIQVTGHDIEWPDMIAHDGDRVVVGRSTDGEDDAGCYQVGDLGDPEHPVWGPVFEATLRVSAVELVGRTLCLGTNRFECWDVTDVQAPVYRGVAGGSKFFLEMKDAGDGLVGCWSSSDMRFLLVVDVTDPAGPVVLADGDVGWGHYRAPYCLSREHIVFREGSGLRRMYSPAGVLSIYPAENAWPVIDTGVPLVTATDGRHVWIQSEGRLLADLAAGTLESVSTPPMPPGEWGFTGAAKMFYHRGHLLHFPGSGYLQVEDVSDPARAVTVAEVRPPAAAIEYMDLEEDRLLLRFRTHAEVYDVADPSRLRLLYSHPLPRPGDRAELLSGCLAIVLDNEGGLDSLSVLVPDGDGSYVEVGHATLENMTDYWTYSLDRDLYTVGCVDDWCFGGSYWRRHDLRSPAAPQRVIPGAPPWPGGTWAIMELGARRCLLAASSGYPYETHTWELSAVDGPYDPDRPAWAALELPGDPIRVTTRFNRAVVLHPGAVSTFQVTAETSGTVPSGGSAATVRAVPNPLNPLTEIVFTMAEPGPATVEIFDVRGRRVLGQGGVWLQGENRLPWSGQDGEGRAMAAGVYLLRVTTPTGTAHGRCTIIR